MPAFHPAPASRSMWSLAGVVLGASLLVAPAAQAFPFGNRDRDRAQDRTTAATEEATPAAGRPAAGRGAPRSSRASEETTARAAMTPPVQMPGEVAAPGVGSGQETAASAAPATPATPEQRRAAASLDLVRQADFWMAELELNPRDIEAAQNAATAFLALGGSERAAQAAATGIQAAPEHPGLWAALGRALLQGSQDAAAAQALTKASQLNPRDAAVLSLVGVAHDRLGRPDLAAPSYERALQIAPADPAILTNFGLSKALAGDLPGAERLLRQAANDPTAPPQARQNLALVVGLQGRLEESERLAALDLPPTVAAQNVATLRALVNGGPDRWRATTN
jgi:Flp pilus assembly protein TadD